MPCSDKVKKQSLVRQVSRVQHRRHPAHISHCPRAHQACSPPTEAVEFTMLTLTVVARPVRHHVSKAALGWGYSHNTNSACPWTATNCVATRSVSYSPWLLDYPNETQNKKPKEAMSSLSRRACYKCGNVGHYAEVCSSSERLCYNCKQPGMLQDNSDMPLEQNAHTRQVMSPTTALTRAPLRVRLSPCNWYEMP